MRGLLLLGLVVVGGYYAWTHFPVAATTSNGALPANYNQIGHSHPKAPQPTLGGSDHLLTSIVGGNYQDAYLRGESAAATSVSCPEVSSAALDAKRSSWGATGSFYDCSISLADGSSKVECWFKAGGNYRSPFIVPSVSPGPGHMPIKGSCEFFAGTTSRMNFTDVQP
jgi:hypothetical protein